MLKILPYLKLAVEKNASDIFFTTNAPAMLKIEGEMLAVGKNLMTNSLIRELVENILTPEQMKVLEEHFEIDLATDAGGLGRFRVNVFTQRNSIAMVLRYVKAEIPSIEKLGVPEVLKDLIMMKRGMILMVGATGSGKSTTLAAMISHRNDNATGHILTIEDPIEYTFRHSKSIIGQREVGFDTHSYANAMREAMREAPDMIMVGEVRDTETMDAVLGFADTGHLVLSTLHATNVIQALERMLYLFPSENKGRVLMDLSLNLRGIVAQRLIPDEHDGLHLAAEVLVNTPYVSRPG